MTDFSLNGGGSIQLFTAATPPCQQAEEGGWKQLSVHLHEPACVCILCLSSHYSQRRISSQGVRPGHLLFPK